MNHFLKSLKKFFWLVGAYGVQIRGKNPVAKMVLLLRLSSSPLKVCVEWYWE